jgi:hypothetical protein
MGEVKRWISGGKKEHGFVKVPSLRSLVLIIRAMLE